LRPKPCAPFWATPRCSTVPGRRPWPNSTAGPTGKTALAEDVHILFPGTDPTLAGQILVVDAPYDATALVPGRAPGADEAASVAALVRLARQLAARPPARPVMLVAVSGHAQAQAGLREYFAALRAKGKDLRSQARAVREERRSIEATLAGLGAPRSRCR